MCLRPVKSSTKTTPAKPGGGRQTGAILAGNVLAENFFKKHLTKAQKCAIVSKHSERNPNAGVAQLVEQLICNQQVGGSSPSTSSILDKNRIWKSSRAAKGSRL